MQTLTKLALVGLLGAACSLPQALHHPTAHYKFDATDADADAVPFVPGFGAPPSRVFSGYLNASDTKFLHYVFVESEQDPETDPVVLWLNGGPGCSSLDGFVYEHGPFQFDPTDSSKVTLRPYRWTRVASMIYLEAPVGVGFSYATGPTDYNCTDDTTANDNLLALEQFFLRFPDRRRNQFFITGESYAGIYVPTLAEAIMHATDAGQYTGAPLIGIAVGNGCSGNTIGICGHASQGTYYDYKFLAGHAFYSDDLKQQIDSTCNWTAAMNNQDLDQNCLDLLDQASNQIGDINIYNVFGDCVNPTTSKSASGALEYQSHSKVPHQVRRGLLGLRGPDECIDSRAATNYFQLDEVLKAFHLHPLSYEFNVCRTPQNWNYQSTRPNLPRDTYPALIKRYRVLIYNGDWDACVPFTDNESWTEGMGLQPEQDWHAWTYTSDSPGVGKQVGGYAVKYSVPGALVNSWFRFITVRGGRHEVPETAPDKALEMLVRLMQDQPF